MGELAGYAAERGVVIAIEPHVGTMLDTPPRVVELVDSMGLDNLRVNFDISHFNVMGIDIETSVSALAPLSATPTSRTNGAWHRTTSFSFPGEGEFDYVTYLKAMRRHGYTGFISAEISVMVQRREGYDAIAAAQQTYDVLDAAFREAGIDRG